MTDFLNCHDERSEASGISIGFGPIASVRLFVLAAAQCNKNLSVALPRICIWEMYEKNSPDHAMYHDNMFCHNHEETIDFMKDVKVPWIAFKVLAAGAIPPADGLNFAFAGGADFICLGMFDYQVRQDTELTLNAIAKSENRKRPWT